MWWNETGGVGGGRGGAGYRCGDNIQKEFREIVCGGAERSNLIQHQ